MKRLLAILWGDIKALIPSWGAMLGVTVLVVVIALLVTLWAYIAMTLHSLWGVPPALTVLGPLAIWGIVLWIASTSDRDGDDNGS